MNRSELKAKAKENLKGHYREAIKVFLLYILVCLVITFVISGIFKSNELLTSILGVIPSFLIIGFYGGFFCFFL